MRAPLPEAEEAYRNLLAQLRAVDLDGIYLVGIHSGGVWIANRLSSDLGLTNPVGSLDISFYRDDFSRIGLHAEQKSSELEFPVEDARIVLVDDVLYTGRTIRGALNVLFDYGRCASVELAVLIERPGRELPIEARWVGAHAKLSDREGLVLAREGEGSEGRFVLSIEPLDRHTPLS